MPFRCLSMVSLRVHPAELKASLTVCRLCEANVSACLPFSFRRMILRSFRFLLHRM